MCPHVCCSLLPDLPSEEFYATAHHCILPVKVTQEYFIAYLALLPLRKHSWCLYPRSFELYPQNSAAHSLHPNHSKCSPKTTSVPLIPSQRSFGNNRQILKLPRGYQMDFLCLAFDGDENLWQYFQITWDHQPWYLQQATHWAKHRDISVTLNPKLMGLKGLHSQDLISAFQISDCWLPQLTALAFGGC